MTMSPQQVNNFPCVCGHYYTEHAVSDFWKYEKFCLECGMDDIDKNSKTVTCPEYKPDNLKYLENRAN